MYRKPVSVKLDLAVLKSRGINWTRRCHVLETCGYERVKIAVLGPVALEGVLMIVKQCSSLLSPSKDRGSKEEGKQMLKWRRKSENVVKWSEVKCAWSASRHPKHCPAPQEETICRAQRNETCKKKKEFRAGRKTNFPTTPFSRPTNVVVFGKGKKKVDLFQSTPCRHRGSRGTAPLIFNFGARWRSGFNYTPLSLLQCMQVNITTF